MLRAVWERARVKINLKCSAATAQAAEAKQKQKRNTEAIFSVLFKIPRTGPTRCLPSVEPRLKTAPRVTWLGSGIEKSNKNGQSILPQSRDRGPINPRRVSVILNPPRAGFRFNWLVPLPPLPAGVRGTRVTNSRN